MFTVHSEADPYTHMFRVYTLVRESNITHIITVGYVKSGLEAAEMIRRARLALAEWPSFNPLDLAHRQRLMRASSPRYAPPDVVVEFDAHGLYAISLLHYGRYVLLAHTCSKRRAERMRMLAKQALCDYEMFDIGDRESILALRQLVELARG